MIRLVNTTDKNVYLKGNKIVAMVSPFHQDSVFCLDNDQSDLLSEHKSEQKLGSAKSEGITFDLSGSNLNENQKKGLLEVLHKNIDVFSKGPYDLGKTHLQTHEIDTGDAQTSPYPIL